MTVNIPRDRFGTGTAIPAAGGPQTDFERSLRDLSDARARYETIRRTRTATFTDRIEAKNRLDAARLDMARVRRAVA